MINFLIVYLLIGLGQAGIFWYALKRTNYPMSAADYAMLLFSAVSWPIELFGFLIYLTHTDGKDTT